MIDPQGELLARAVNDGNCDLFGGTKTNGPPPALSTLDTNAGEKSPEQSD